MPWFQISYRAENGRVTELTSSPREAASAAVAVFEEKLQLCSRDLGHRDEQVSVLELDASFFALCTRWGWDGDLIAIEVSPPTVREESRKGRIIMARRDVD